MIMIAEWNVELYVSKIYGYKREIDKTNRERWNDGESVHCGSMLNQY